MRDLPLYVDHAQRQQPQPGLPRDENCTRCDLSERAKTVCIPAERAVVRDPDDDVLMLVGEAPGRIEDTSGRPFSGPGGRSLRAMVAKHWDGPVVFDNVLRCFGGSSPGRIATCRPYVHESFLQTNPDRVVALGTQAILGIAERSVPVLSVRRGYAWVQHPDRTEPTPVFYTMHPTAGLRNDHVMAFIESDLRWALNVPYDKLVQPPWDGVTHSVESVEDSKHAVARLREYAWGSYDTETAGRPYSKFFEVNCLSASRPDGENYTWGRKALESAQVRAPLLELLADSGWGKVGHNLKYDFYVVACAFDVRVRGFYGDTRLWRKLQQADANGKLEYVSELVGMGGYKQEFDKHLQRAVKSIQKERKLAASSKSGWLPGMVDPVLEAAVEDSEAEPKTYAFGLVEEGVRQRYCARDAVATAYIARELEAPIMRRYGHVWNSIVRDATEAIEQIEHWGIGADRRAIGAFNTFISTKLAQTNKRLQKYGDFNPESPQQVADLLFDKLNLRQVNGRSTDKSVMKALEGQHPVLDDMKEYRRLAKLRSAYGKPMANFIRLDDRIHPQLKIDGTECMPAGELVLTDRGYLPVEQVEVADRVLTHKGRARPVVARKLFSSTPIYEVRLRTGAALRTSANHQFYVIGHDGPEWVRADKLREGMAVVVLGNGSAEEWRVVAGWEDFAVSSWGRVRNVHTGRVRAQHPKGRWGHLKVCLSRYGAQKRGKDRKDFAVHRLVADAFEVSGVGPEVRHLNGVAWDNRPENLERGTRKQNGQDAARHGSMSKRGKGSKLTQTDVDYMRAQERPPKGGRGRWKRDGDTWVSDAELAQRFGVTRELVRDIRSGKRWQPREPESCVLFGAAAVESVRCAGEEPVYGLTVAEDTSHVTACMVSHNTGRLSCLDPALHQIPRKKDADGNSEGKMIKDCFIAPYGYRLLQLDYSQLELRIAAMLSGDKVMIKMFQDGGDFHMKTAKLISQTAWGIPPGAVEGHHRSGAKTFVFGLLYGMTDGGLSARMNCSRDQATRIRHGVLGEFTDLAGWVDHQINDARKTGSTWTWWDGEPARRRPLWRIGAKGDQDSGSRINAENSAVNSPVQGTASEFCLRSIIEIVRWIQTDDIPAKIVMTVHDSILFEVREDYVDIVRLKASEIMRSWNSLGVPLVVDAEVGQSWGSLQEVLSDEEKVAEAIRMLT